MTADGARDSRCRLGDADVTEAADAELATGLAAGDLRCLEES